MEVTQKNTKKKGYPEELAPYIVEFGNGNQKNEYITYAGLQYLKSRYEKDNDKKLSVITEAIFLSNDNADMVEVYKFWSLNPLFIAKIAIDGVVLATGYGDANEANSGMVKQHRIRLAETRAKARALRELLGVEFVALDEMEQDGKNKPKTPNITPLKKLNDKQFEKFLKQSDDYIEKFYKKVEFTKEQKLKIDERIA